MELKLNDEDMQKLIVELAREMRDEFFNIQMKDYSPEQISEFRFVHSFDSVDQLMDLYHSTPEYCFYDMLTTGVSGGRDNTCDRNYQSPFNTEHFEDHTSRLREFAVQLDIPFNIGFVHIPEHAYHQDSFFRDNKKFTVQNAQKTRNWRGNILTITLDEDLASTPHASPNCYNKDTVVASFRKNDDGLYIPDKYFFKGEQK